MKRKIIKSLKLRLIREIKPSSKLGFLHSIPVEDYYDDIIIDVFLYTRKKVGDTSAPIFSEVVCKLGHTVNQVFKKPLDTQTAAQVGTFILYTFEELGILEMFGGSGKNGHRTYMIKILDDKVMDNLFKVISKPKVEKLPSFEPYADWCGAKHLETGKYIVKTGCMETRQLVGDNEYIRNVLNKLQHKGWVVNTPLIAIAEACLRGKMHAFDNIWKQVNPAARTTKERETHTVLDMAKRLKIAPFYQHYSIDFRGRIYPSAAYFHEQGADLARGLLLRDEKKPIGKEGFFWLMISLAGNWAGKVSEDSPDKTDKIPMKERYLWATENEDAMLAYAGDPLGNRGWMDADKPWQFLAACKELYNIRMWQYERNDFDNYAYESNLEAYVDGSNNGSQHLAALIKDDETALHVNLVPTDLPGDLYKYVAGHVWKQLEKERENLTEEEYAQGEVLLEELFALKEIMFRADDKAGKKVAYEAMNAFKKKHIDLLTKAQCIFWLRFNEKEQRKICKRNVMTLPYGGTAYGLGQQQIDDSKKHGIELLRYMEHKWGAYLGRLVFESSKLCLKKPMQLLAMFEAAGVLAEDEERYLTWSLPISGLVVKQYYTEGVVKRTNVWWGPRMADHSNKMNINTCCIESPVYSSGKQRQGAAPNIIHSLDACHLQMTVAQADFSVSTIHDSFGCLLSDMPALYKLVRKTFVELYMEDPFTRIITEIGGNKDDIEKGELDLQLILNSEYCFL